MLLPFRARLLLPLLLVAALFSGCATPVTHRYGAREARDQFKAIVILPIDVEVSELSAGGLTEKRDDWTAQVADHLNAVVSSRHAYRVATPWPEERSAGLQTELDDMRAVFRAVTFNQILHSYLPGLPRVEAVQGPLVYQVGPVDALLDAQQADAALLLLVRDDYATAGRKGLVFLGAVAGLPVRGGVTIASAALVTRDGRLLWMNVYGAQKGDLRTREGAEDLVDELLEGVIAPSAPVPSPTATTPAAKSAPVS